MTTVRAVKFFFMGVSCLLRYLLLLHIARDDARDGATRDLDLDVVRLDPQDQGIVSIDRHDGSDDAAAGRNRVPVLQARQHPLLLLALFLHRKEQEEIEDSEDEKDGEESHPGAGRRR